MPAGRTYVKSVSIYSCLAQDIRVSYNQVILLQLYPHPLVMLAPDIKESGAVPDVSDLLVFVEVLVKEHLNLYHHAISPAPDYPFNKLPGLRTFSS